MTSIDAINQEKSAQKFSREGKCDFCGWHHRGGKQNCPAFGKICDKCGGKNHFKTVCKLGSGSESGRDQIGHARPRLNVTIDVIFMMLNAVMTALRIVMAQP